LGWPWLWQAYHQWGMPLLGMLVVRSHLRQLLPQRGGAINAALGTVLLAGVVVTGVIKEVTADGLTKLELTATCQGEKVLSLARATIRKR
jgi:hypothetical protein